MVMFDVNNKHIVTRIVYVYKLHLFYEPHSRTHQEIPSRNQLLTITIISSYYSCLMLRETPTCHDSAMASDTAQCFLHCT